MLEAKNASSIAACGFGCALVKTSVFSKVAKGSPPFKWIETGSFICTEDIDFCKRAAAQGCTIKVDPKLLCQHIAKVKLPILNNGN
jgi:GT2 family glycosyltransferase